MVHMQAEEIVDENATGREAARGAAARNAAAARRDPTSRQKAGNMTWT